MNIKFNLGEIKVKLPAHEIDVEVGNISYEITDANPLEIARASSEIAKAIVELKREIESSDHEEMKARYEEQERHEAKMTELRIKDREHRHAARQAHLFPTIPFSHINSGDEGLFDGTEGEEIDTAPFDFRDMSVYKGEPDETIKNPEPETV